MTLNNRPCSPKFGIRFDARLRPSFIALFVSAGLHLGACVIIWQLNCSYWLCLLIDVIILWLMVHTVNRYIFLMSCYQLSFLFDAEHSWIIQENENICYRALACQKFARLRQNTLIFAHCSAAYIKICEQQRAKNQRILARIVEFPTRQKLRYAFCGKYLVILVFQNRLTFPIFFDSLPAAQFRQLRKVLILLDYA